MRLVLSTLLLVGLAACGSASDDAIPANSLVFQVHYDPGPPGGRTFYVDSITSTRTDLHEAYLCHVGSFQSGAFAYQPYIAQLSAVGPVHDPFSGAQFFEQNGTFGYVCARIDENVIPEIQACLDTRSTCRTVSEAEARISDNLRDLGFVPANL